MAENWGTVKQMDDDGLKLLKEIYKLDQEIDLVCEDLNHLNDRKRLDIAKCMAYEDGVYLLESDTDYTPVVAIIDDGSLRFWQLTMVEHNAKKFLG